MHDSTADMTEHGRYFYISVRQVPTGPRGLGLGYSCSNG